MTREKESAAKATVAVTFTEGERRAAADRTVQYDFVREDGRWKIDEIRGAADGQSWSLRKILGASLKR